MYRAVFALFLTTANAFMITPHYYKRPQLRNIEMNYKPQELLESLGKGQLGNEWTYQEFLSNLKGHAIDAATVTDNGRIFFIDNNYQDAPGLFNVHLLKTIPSLTDSVITDYKNDRQ
jgi:hypothetical protein